MGLLREDIISKNWEREPVVRIPREGMTKPERAWSAPKQGRSWLHYSEWGRQERSKQGIGLCRTFVAMETRTCKEGNDIIWFMVFKVRSGCSVENRFRSVSMQQRPVSYGCGPGKWKQSLDPEQWLWTWGDMGRLLYLFWVLGHARELDVGHKWKQM